tara:strand:- start:337 stop:513 length:177 start_codon:yes stop_codon:yes gene_type:complete
MTNLYFLLFCLGIAYIIFWSFRNDDQADFQGQKRDKKFSPSKTETDGGDKEQSSGPIK